MQEARYEGDGEDILAGVKRKVKGQVADVDRLQRGRVHSQRE